MPLVNEIQQNEFVGGTYYMSYDEFEYGLLTGINNDDRIKLLTSLEWSDLGFNPEKDNIGKYLSECDNNVKMRVYSGMAHHNNTYQSFAKVVNSSSLTHKEVFVTEEKNAYGLIITPILAFDLSIGTQLCNYNTLLKNIEDTYPEQWDLPFSGDTSGNVSGII